MANPLFLALSFILHVKINVIVLSKILEPKLALTKIGDLYYLAKETGNEVKIQDATNTKRRSSRHKIRVSETREKTKVKLNK